MTTEYFSAKDIYLSQANPQQVVKLQHIYISDYLSKLLHFDVIIRPIMH